MSLGPEIHNGWRQATLGELLKFSNGRTSPVRADGFPYPVYGSNGIIGYSNDVNAKPETIIIGRVGTYCGSLRYSDISCWVTDNAICAIATAGNDAPFLFFLLETLRLNEWRTGSGQPLLNQSILASIPVNIPGLPEQQAIAHVLGTLDDKIELNRRMNRTLEEMARAIFQDWFVDFGPTRAKMEGLDPYLPPELWDLFPDELVDSELGEIPEGWKVGALSDYASLNQESWSKKTLPNEIEYVDLANTKWGTIESTQHFSGEAAPSRAKRVLRSGDTIVGTVRPGNGSFSLVGRNGLTGSTGFAVLRPLHHWFRELVYLAATDPDNIERLTHRADGGAYPAVRPEVVAESQVVTPNEGTISLDHFSNVIRPLLDKIEKNQAELRMLATLRDELLPGLISGELNPAGD